MIQRIKEFFQEVKLELGRVNFPTLNETLGATAVVIVFVVVMSIFLAVADVALSRVVTWLIG